MQTNVTEGVDYVLAQLTPKMIRYAADPKRGSYRGFAALHDVCDANMLLPGVETDVITDATLNYWHAVMAGVTLRLVAQYRPRRFEIFIKAWRRWCRQRRVGAQHCRSGAARRDVPCT